MNTAVTSRLSRWVAGFIAVALVAGGSLIATAPATAVPAGSSTVTGGSLEWGVDAPYRTLFAKYLFAGSPATVTAAPAFSFPAATTSTYDADAQTGTLNFSGNARIGYYAGAPAPGVSTGNYFYISNPVVTISGTTGTISGSTAGSSHDLNPDLPTAPLAVRTIANLDLSNVTPTVNGDGTLITFTAVPTTITEAGSTVLASYNSAGDAAATKRAVGSALDPITIQLAVAAPVVPATVTTTALTAPATATVGTTAAISATVAPANAAGNIEFFDGATSLATAPVASGTASATPTFTTAGVHAITAVFTPTDSAAFAASTSAASTVTVSNVPVATAPSLSVSKTTGLNPAGETITVTGTNYDTSADASQMYGGGKAGVYAQVGWLDSTWRPSAGALSANRSNAASVWVKDVAPSAAYVAWTDNGDGTANFTWTTTITKAALDAKTRSGATLAVFTLGAGGVVQAGNELAVPIAFQGAPTLSVSKTTGLNPAGETITVTGTNYDTSADASQRYGGGKAGVYAQVGWLDPTWRPSAGALSSNRSNAASVWVKDVAPSASYVAWTDNGDGTANFTWTTTITKAALDAKSRSGATLAVFTLGAAGVVQAGNELSVPIAFAAAPTATTTALTASPATVTAGTATTLTAKVSPAAAGTVTFSTGATTVGVVALDSAGTATQVTPALAAGTTSYTATFAPTDPTLFVGSTSAVSVVANPVAPSTASLDWGVKQSFREYITGPIAAGTITTTGVTDNNGIYNFPFKTGGSYSAGTGTGSSLYTGSVHFSGHHGALDITFADPIIRVTSPTAATLSVKVGGESSVIANLDLSAATVSSTTNSKSFAGAPAALTEAGNVAFGGFYAAGTALDPVSFTIDTTVVTVPTDPEEPLPPVVTPTRLAVTASPASVTAGATTTLTAKVAPVAAGTVTFSKGGTRLGSVTVGSTGVAKYTTTALVAGTSTFTATFVPTDTKLYSGSSNTVAVVAKPVAPSTASLDWGVKQSFREYIVGPIANGSIDTIGVTDAGGIYGFPFKTGGSYDAGTGLGTSLYTGSVHFTGHSGALDIEFSDPSIRVTGTKTGTLSVKVDGGAAVTIATLDLGTATSTSTATSKTFTAAMATLTADGNTAFGGFYAAGTALDPVTFTIDTTVPTVPTDPTDPTDPEVPLPPVVTATSLTLAASPDTITVGASTTLTAQVAPVTAGTVTFAAGTTALGTVPVSATGGAAFAVDNLPAGVQQFTATFAPADAALYSGSSATAAVSVVAKTVGAGSLKWGVKQSFRDYVTGTIAKGAISTSGVASSGGVFTFGQSSGGSFDFATGVGTSNYNGTVRFTGHAGALDIALSNPVVRIDNVTQGTLLVSVNGGASTPFATLDLAAATRTTPDNTVSYSGVPTSLTAEGAAVFSLNGSGFYPVGTALDPVGFVIGAPNVVSATVGATVASFTPANTAAPTPPATTGITVTQGTELVAGDEVTITATGFQPNETGILVVIYSTPTVLDTNATADATGTVTWTGRLPAELSGLHTLTFQGSVDRGVELNIAPAAASEAVTGCVVDDATITWGFKESFRAYISGSIASGEWTVADGATYAVPNFGWSAGTGGYDAESGEGLLAFAGSINFTGHAGVLNTTVANPQIRFVDADSAVLLLDISGTTQDGAAIDTKAVEFADLDLSGVLENDEGSVTITAAPATLTAAGAAAFGTYPAGEELDPVTVAFTTAADCAVVEEESTPAVTSTTDAVSTDSAVDFGWLIWVILALVVVAAAVVITVVLRRRKA